MKPGELAVRLESYLALQQALDFPLKARERLLRSFVSFVEVRNEPGPITAQTALDWACAASDRCGATGRAGRLSVARQFLLHLSALVPGTEVPGAGLLARARRPKPFLFSSVEIQTLLMEAGKLEPIDSLRPHTMQIILGLLASTGLRAGEAVRLQVMSYWMPTHRDCSCVKLSSANHDLFRCTILLRHRCANMPSGDVICTMTDSRTFSSYPSRAGNCTLPR